MPMFADLLSRLLRPDPASLPEPDARLALVALMVRLARADGVYDAAERARIEAIARARHGLDAPAVRALREAAERLEAEAPDTVRFTRAIKAAVPHEARIEVVEALWQVALADGARDAGEDALIRMAARLLGVSDGDSARARQRVARG